MPRFYGVDMVELYAMDTGCFADKELFAEVYRSLSQNRRNKIDAYKYDSDKFLSMGAGYLLERGLRNMNIPTQIGYMEYGRNGKPCLRSSERTFHFNISHSGVYAVCAFSTTEVGVDIQKKTPTVNDRMLRVSCSPREYVYLTELDGAELVSEFYRAWTIKESFMKYLGTGLSLPPSEIDIDFNLPVSVRVGGERKIAFFKEYPLDGYSLTACSGVDVFAPSVKTVFPRV